MKRTLAALGLALGLALALTSCSGDDAPAAPTVDEGTTTTAWASGQAAKPPVTPGAWRAAGPDPGFAGFRLLRESAHFAFYSDETVAEADLQRAVDSLENVVWPHLFEVLRMPEPFADRADKIKIAVHIRAEFGLSASLWFDDAGLLHPAMFIGPGALSDLWGLAHEFTHTWQFWARWQGGLDCPDTDTCNWLFESHANYTAHQLPAYQDFVHCTEMLANAPHLYLGSSRDRYCNWQFLEYLKDRHGQAAVTQIWTTPGSDPLTNLRSARGWTLEQLNDFLGEWAMHNVTWDYRATPQAFRASFGPIVQADRAERLRRLMPLEPLDADWAGHRRFVVPYHGAPQRGGYNVVRLFPEAGADTIRVRFRGIDAAGSNAGFRWGLVATDAGFTSARYSQLQRGLDGELTFRVKPGEPLFLVVTATPVAWQPIVGEQDYHTIWRYRYMVELARAWPQGFRDGAREACPEGTVRHANGGGCAPAGTPATVYVGPYATVLAGASASGTARLEDHAIVANGSVSGGVVGGLSVIGGFGNPGTGYPFAVSGTARVRTAFYPLGFFEPGQQAGGSVHLYGDAEVRGENLALTEGDRSGFVDQNPGVGSPTDINPAAAPAWR